MSTEVVAADVDMAQTVEVAKVEAKEVAKVEAPKAPVPDFPLEEASAEVSHFFSMKTMFIVFNKFARCTYLITKIASKRFFFE